MRVLVLFAVAFGIGTNIPALRASEHVLLDKKGVQVKLRIQGIAGYEGERWRSDKNFERSFSVQNESNEEVINLSVIVVDIQPHDSQPTSAVNPINHSWKLGTCWSIHCWGTEQTGYSASHSSNASARWEHNKTVIRLGVVLETRCTLGSGALLKARRKIPIEVETISESDLRAAQSWVNDACNNLSNSVVGNERERYSLLNGLETTLGMPEVVAGLSENQRDYLLKLRLAPNTRSFPRVANQISLSISKQGLSKQPILDRYSRMLLESPKYAVSDLMELDSWDRSLEEPLMMVFEDDPNPDMLNAIGMLVRRHNILVNRRRLTAALRRHGHLADSPKERPPSPVRVRTKINTFRIPPLFPDARRREMWLAANPDWPRDEDGNLIERFRTQTNSVLPGFAPRRLCRLLATVGDTSTIESDLMPLLDRKEKIGTYPTSAPGHRRQPVRDYVSSPRLCDWACDSILTIVGIRVSKAYDQAAMDLGALELTARNLPGRSVFRAGEDKLHFKGFTSTFDFSDATRLDSAGKLTSSDTLTTTVSTPHLHVSDNVIRIRDRMLENLRAE